MEPASKELLLPQPLTPPDVDGDSSVELPVEEPESCASLKCEEDTEALCGLELPV